MAQLAACSYSVGWYLLWAGTRWFMNLKREAQFLETRSQNSQEACRPRGREGLHPHPHDTVLDYPVFWILNMATEFANYWGTAFSRFPIFCFFYTSLTDSIAPQGYSLMEFYSIKGTA